MLFRSDMSLKTVDLRKMRSGSSANAGESSMSAAIERAEALIANRNMLISKPLYCELLQDHFARDHPHGQNRVQDKVLLSEFGNIMNKLGIALADAPLNRPPVQCSCNPVNL